MVSYSEKGVILKADDVCVSLDGNPILRKINLEVQDIIREGVQQGQVVSIVGRSGCGKTTLFKALSGLSKPTSGTIKIGFEQKIVEAGQVGIVPQNYLLFNHRLIIKNLRIALDNSGQKLSDKEKTEIIYKYASDFELKDHLYKYPEQLSGGQRQRVSILQQILTGNKFLLLDEPFSGLDSLMVGKVLNLLIKISLLDEMNTLIIVSHDIRNALAISDLVWVLKKEEGKEGATITETIDLKKMDLAWQPDIKRNPQFNDLVEHVRTLI